MSRGAPPPTRFTTVTCEKPFPSDGDLFDKPRDSMFDDAVLGWFRTLVRRAKRCAMEAGIGMPLDDLEVLLQATEDDKGMPFG